MAHFSRVCRQSGVKVTHQRMEIYREVAQTSDHPSVERIYAGVRRRMPTVSRDTVYRTLWWLTDLGMVNTLGSPRDRSRFYANLDQHHHFVCLRCGLTRDFHSDELNLLNIAESVGEHGCVETLQVEVKGICHDCRKKHEPNIQDQRTGASR